MKTVLNALRQVFCFGLLFLGPPILTHAQVPEVQAKDLAEVREGVLTRIQQRRDWGNSTGNCNFPFGSNLFGLIHALQVPLLPGGHDL